MLSVAVFGSGPAGFYTIEALFKQTQVPVRVDLFDRLPMPFGLVRFGVAPDHQNIKAVIKVYEKLATDPRFRFFGNVELGKDLSLNEVLTYYDQVVIATGCAADKKMGILGEDADGCYSATDFVAWYNGHPDYCQHQFRLEHRRAAVVGVGNVAMDVTRILLKDRDELAKTDIADYALTALKQSAIREVVLLGRRGPAQAAFSNKEICEIAELPDVAVEIDAALLDGIQIEGLDKDTRKNIEFFWQCAKTPKLNAPKRVKLRFLTSPAEILVNNGAVVGLKIEKNQLSDNGPNAKASGTGQFELLEVGTVFRSIGYRGTPIAGVPFDDKSGLIPNQAGRVLDSATGQPLPGVYTAGWIKRGPSGLVGSNKPDAAATVANMLADATQKRAGAPLNDDPQAIIKLLTDKNIRSVSYADWRKLDALEQSNGKAVGKVRQKFVTLADALVALGA